MTKVKKFIVICWDLLGATKKVNPETWAPCGSCKLLVSNIAHQMKEKLMIRNRFFSFLDLNEFF